MHYLLTTVFLRSRPTKRWHLLRGNECSYLTVKLDKENTRWLSQWDSEKGWRDEKSKASGLNDQKILKEFRCFSEPGLPRNHKGSASLMRFTILFWFQLETTLYFSRFFCFQPKNKNCKSTTNTLLSLTELLLASEKISILVLLDPIWITHLLSEGVWKLMGGIKKNLSIFLTIPLAIAY